MKKFLQEERGGGGGRKKIKNGIHIVWPHIIVDSKHAWTLRACFLHELCTVGIPSIPKESLCDEWDKVLDPCVFGKNGLRMIWNRKASTCKTCKGIPFQRWIMERRKRTKGLRGPMSEANQIVERPDIVPCKICGTFDNKVDEGRPYDAVAVFDCDDPAENMRKLSNPVFALSITSIRLVLPRGSPTVTITPMSLDKPTLEMVAPWCKKVRSDVGGAIYPAMQISEEKRDYAIKRSIDDVGHRSSSLIPVFSDEIAHEVLSQYALDFLHCATTSLRVDGDRHLYILNTNSRSCRNKGSDHDRSCIYFVFYPDGCVQKCWAGSGKIHHAGGFPCNAYRSRLIVYDPSCVYKIRKLFAQKYANKFPFVLDPPQVLDHCSTSTISPGVVSPSQSFLASFLAAPKTSPPSLQSPILSVPSSLPVTSSSSIGALKPVSFSEQKAMIEKQLKDWMSARAAMQIENTMERPETKKRKRSEK